MSWGKLKSTLKGILLQLGLDVRYAAPHDALTAKKRLLAGLEVKLIIDGGGYLGEWTSRYRKAFPTASVVVFEPFLESVGRLKNIFKADTNVSVVEKALGESAGSRTLYCNGLAATNSVFPVDRSIHKILPDPEWVTPKAEINISEVPLDVYCKSAGIDRVNILKLDIQGAELLALQGARELLQKKAVDLIYSELLFHPHYDGQAQHFDVAAFLHGHGYDLYGMYNLAVSRAGCMWQADGIFVSPELRRKSLETRPV